MSDLFLNEDFAVEIGPDGNLKTVSGHQRAKQSVIVHVTSAVGHQIGRIDDKQSFIKGITTRVVKKHGLIDDVSDISVAEQEAAGSYVVSVTYQTDTFSFEVSS